MDVGKIQRTERHHFIDASWNGYGQASYIRVVGENKVHCSLIIGKARVSPTKIITIPRLDLTAAVVSSVISNMLKEELELHVNKEYFGIYSQVFLGYINNEARRFHVFVANRVKRIREITDSPQWCYRGLSVTELISSNWLTGPEFLWERETVTSKLHSELMVGDPEVRTAQILYTKAENEESFLYRLKHFKMAYCLKCCSSDPSSSEKWKNTTSRQRTNSNQIYRIMVLTRSLTVEWTVLDPFMLNKVM